jgi:hypothetical protein
MDAPEICKCILQMLKVLVFSILAFECCNAVLELLFARLLATSQQNTFDERAIACSLCIAI